MINDLFWPIYRSPLKSILNWIFILTVIWIVLSVVFGVHHKSAVIWRIVNSLLFILGIGIMIRMTLLERSVASRGAELVPFRSLFAARTHRELYREKLMNVFLYVPLGMTLPFLAETITGFRGKKAGKTAGKYMRISVICLLFLSIMIECSQWFFSVGLAETDDVIANTLGSLIGAASYYVSQRVLRMISPSRFQ